MIERAVVAAGIFVVALGVGIAWNDEPGGRGLIAALVLGAGLGAATVYLRRRRNR